MSGKEDLDHVRVARPRGVFELLKSARDLLLLGAGFPFLVDVEVDGEFQWLSVGQKAAAQAVLDAQKRALHCTDVEIPD